MSLALLYIHNVKYIWLVRFLLVFANIRLQLAEICVILRNLQMLIDFVKTK